MIFGTDGLYSPGTFADQWVVRVLVRPGHPRTIPPTRPSSPPALSTALKFRGSFSLQAKGDGPISMLLADCTDAGELRGHALTNRPSWRRCWRGPLALGRGVAGQRLSRIYRRQGGEQNRHQGIVAIEGGSLAEMALHYFDTSEQLRCQVHLACEQTASAGGPAR